MLVTEQTEHRCISNKHMCRRQHDCI